MSTEHSRQNVKYVETWCTDCGSCVVGKVGTITFCDNCPATFSVDEGRRNPFK